MFPPLPDIGTDAVLLEDGAALLTVGLITLWLTPAAVRDLRRLIDLPPGACLDAVYRDVSDADSGWTAEILLHRDANSVWHLVAAVEDEIATAQVSNDRLAISLTGDAA